MLLSLLVCLDAVVVVTVGVVLFAVVLSRFFVLVLVHSC